MSRRNKKLKCFQIIPQQQPCAPPPPPCGPAPCGPARCGPPPCGPMPYAQLPFAPAPFGQVPFGQAPFGQAPFGQVPFAQAPFGQPQFAQAPYSPFFAATPMHAPVPLPAPTTVYQETVTNAAPQVVTNVHHPNQFSIPLPAQAPITYTQTFAQPCGAQQRTFFQPIQRQQYPTTTVGLNSNNSYHHIASSNVYNQL